MKTRKKLQELLSEYVKDTLNYIETVRDFCDKQQIWTLKREEELNMMKYIKDKADKELEKKLGAVLKNTLQGLEELDFFMDAVENLAVTSTFVFSGQSFLPEDKSPESVRSVITAARMSSPILVHFKRNAKTFFIPSLSNLDVLSFQLDKYIRITKQICERMEKNSKSDLWYKDIRRKKARPVLKFSLKFSEDSMQKMLDHLKQLCKIRVDQHTKLTFIFQDYALRFIDVFSQCHSRMEKHLSDLEESAVQLDKMKKGASISAVAGSSVGIVGGALSIVGIALAPVTAGVSLGLTIAGLSAGVTSGANSLITGITEAGVNQWHGTKSQNIFKQYMDDVEKILNCLDQAGSQEHVEGPGGFSFNTAGKLAFTRAKELGKDIKGIKDAASAVKVLKTEKVIADATKAGLQEAQSARNIPKLAAELPDIGQLAKGTPLALTKSARAGLIGLNALFIGLDAYSIYKESISLANGSKSESSQLIRSRASLWRSELEAWKMIHDSLCVGIKSVRKSQEVLEKPFLPLQHRTWLLVLLCCA